MDLTRRQATSLCSVCASVFFGRTGVAQSPGSNGLVHQSDDPFSYVNPEFRDTLERRAKKAGPEHELNTSTLPQFRAMSSTFASPVLPAPIVQEQTIPGAPGRPQVRVYIVGVTTGASKPAVLYFHGGGYFVGSASSDKRDLQDISTAYDCLMELTLPNTSHPFPRLAERVR